MKNKKVLDRILWCLCIGVAVVMFVSFMFPDMIITTKNGMMVWDALFSGRIREFYVLNEHVFISNNFNIDSFAMYDFPIYIVFAIWNAPLWLFERITHTYALDTLGGLLWAKAISIPFIVLIYLFIKKIAKLINEEEYDKINVVYYLSSVFLFVPVFVMGQYDAIGLLFIIIGVYEYIKKDTKKFVLFFAIAITFKMFALFVFIPLVLLKEKKIGSIVVQTIGGLSLLLVFRILQNSFFIPSTMAKEYATSHFADFIFQNEIGLGYSMASMFFLCFVLFGLYCLFQKKPNDEELGRWAVYVSYVGLSIFFLSSLTHPQWSLLLLPFSVLIVSMYGKESYKVGAIADSVGNIGLVIAQIFFYYWVFSVGASKYTLAGELLYTQASDGKTVRGIIEKWFSEINPDYFIYAGNGIFVACILFLIYWANPKTDRKKYENVEISVDSMIGIRVGVMIALTYLMYIMFV